MNYEEFVNNIEKFDKEILNKHDAITKTNEFLKQAYINHDKPQILESLIKSKRLFEELIKLELEMIELLFGKRYKIKVGYWFNEHRQQINKARLTLKTINQAIKNLKHGTEE